MQEKLEKVGDLFFLPHVLDELPSRSICEQACHCLLKLSKPDGNY